jgi:hypothetical protein
MLSKNSGIAALRLTLALPKRAFLASLPETRGTLEDLS